MLARLATATTIAGLAASAFLGCSDQPGPEDAAGESAHAAPGGSGEPAPGAGEPDGSADDATVEASERPVRPRPLDHGPRNARRVALTFDADMTPEMQAEARRGGSDSYDREIARKLRRWEVPATIFVTGLWAQTHPDAVRSFARSELFELASHSHDHSAWTEDCYGLPAISSKREKRRQVLRPARIIGELTGEPPHWFRFPGLCHEPHDVRLVAQLGQQVVDGDVSSGDAFNPDPVAVAATVLDEVRPGSIVVMHLHGAPNAPATSAALDLIVPGLRDRGYRLVTLSALFDHS